MGNETTQILHSQTTQNLRSISRVISFIIISFIIISVELDSLKESINND